MDPEVLRGLLQAVREARQAGFSDREINQRLRRRRELPIDDLAGLEQEAKAAEILGPGGLSELNQMGEGGEEGDRSFAADLLRMVGQGLTFGAGDELAGAAAAAGAVVPGGRSPGEAFESAQQHAEQNLQEARENTGVAGFAADVGGSLLPLLTGLPAAARALGKGGKAVKSGIQALRSAGGREAVKEGAERLGREVPSLIKPTLRGGAEGGVLGAGATAAEVGLRSEGDVGERLEAIKDQASTVTGGGLLGVAIGMPARGVPAIKRRIRAPDESGEVLGRAMRKEGDVTGRASRTEEAIKGRKQQAREELIRPLEQQGREIPLEVTETVLKNPILREQARATAPRVVETAEAAAKGQRGSSIPLTADEALSIHRGVRERASAFKRAAGGDLAASVDPVDVKKAEQAFEELDEVMSQRLEGFPEFQARWAREKQTGRALIAGRKVANKPADDVSALWEGKTPADKSLKREFPNGLPDDPQVRKAFREGIATEMISDLEKGKSGVRSFIDRAKTGSQTREKLKIVLGGNEENLNRFIRAVEAEGKIMNRAEMTKELVKAAGFLGLGTSLFGGAAIDVLF